MEDKRIEGMTIDDAVQKYERMVYKVVNSANTNAVCNAEDLIQEGYMAIVEAFNTYDPEKGTAFSTWVYRYITGAILDYQKIHLNTLAGGAYLQSVMRKAGPDATPEDLIALGCRKETAYASTYINENFAAADYEALEELICDGDSMFDKMALKLFDWRKHLTEEEVFVLESYYGFNGESIPQTEIAKVLGKHRRTVGDIIQRALMKLRRNPDVVDYAFD